MKIINILYWITTILISALLGFSGFNDVMKSPDFVKSMQHLGYPEYLLIFLGVAKLSAIMVLLLPIKTRLKDWAYAGVVINLIGASYSHYMSGDDIQTIFIPVVGCLITLVSYFLYLRKYRKNKY